jgi:hypothetical protein
MRCIHCGANSHVSKFCPKMIKDGEFTGGIQAKNKEDLPCDSVLQDWVSTISLRQQGVLIIATRGPDGCAKEDPAKPLVRTLRALIMNTGRLGRPQELGTLWKDDTFMTTWWIADAIRWNAVAKAFFDQWDSYNVHFLQHLMHGYGVLGANHPNELVKSGCWWFYEKCCRKLHVTPEIQEQLAHRLRDGIRHDEDE